MFALTGPARRVVTFRQTASPCKRLCTSSLRGNFCQEKQRQQLHRRKAYSAAAVSPSGDFSAKGYSAAETSEYDNMGTQAAKTDAPTRGERGPVHTEQEQKQGGGLLKGKWALVTGTSRGIGRAIAEAFAAESASLIITSEPQAKEDLEKVADSCKEHGAADVKVVYADLTDPQETKRLGEEALKLSGGCVNVLVNNAGVYFPMSFDEGPNKGQGPLDGNPDDWDKQTHINLMAPMRLTRMLLNPMKDAGEGHVVNIASIEALYPYPSAPAYSATKWGLRGWSKALFAALKSDNIKVLTVNPAQVNTPMTRSRPDAEYLPDKMIQPNEIAEAIVMTFRLNPNAFLEEITLQTAEPPKKPKE